MIQLASVRLVCSAAPLLSFISTSTRLNFSVVVVLVVVGLVVVVGVVVVVVVGLAVVVVVATVVVVTGGHFCTTQVAVRLAFQSLGFLSRLHRLARTWKVLPLLDL